MANFFRTLHRRRYQNKLRKKIKKCGRDLYVFGDVYVDTPNTIEIGNGCRLNEGCRLVGRNGGSIRIGDDVTLSTGATVLAGEYDVDKWIKTGEKDHKAFDTVIGDHVWVCANATIVAGVRITGEYVVIAAGAVVTSDISESYCVYAGVPAKCVKYYMTSESI